MHLRSMTFRKPTSKDSPSNKNRGLTDGNGLTNGNGTNVVETQSQTLSVGAANASGSSAGGSTIAMTLVAGTALGLLVGISRRKT